MEFKQGTNVYTTNGEDVGTVDRVVLNPKTKEVTHIVVRKGFFFAEDKVIPIDLISSATEEGVRLRGISSDLDTLSPFEETHYLPLDETESSTANYPTGWASPYYWYEPLGGMMGYANYQAGFNHPFRSEVEKNIPEGTIALREGARVITTDGKDVGSVKRIFTNSQNDQATHIVISEGLLFKERRLISVDWIHDIQEDEVHLNVGSAMLAKLPEYKESYPEATS